MVHTYIDFSHSTERLSQLLFCLRPIFGLKFVNPLSSSVLVNLLGFSYFLKMKSMYKCSTHVKVVAHFLPQVEEVRPLFYIPASIYIDESF
jgi:hypothetical protein